MLSALVALRHLFERSPARVARWLEHRHVETGQPLEWNSTYCSATPDVCKVSNGEQPAG